MYTSPFPTKTEVLQGRCHTALTNESPRYQTVISECRWHEATHDVPSPDCISGTNNSSQRCIDRLPLQYDFIAPPMKKWNPALHPSNLHSVMWLPLASGTVASMRQAEAWKVLGNQEGPAAGNSHGRYSFNKPHWGWPKPELLGQLKELWEVRNLCSE